jgi:hypothetical protein
MPRPILGVAIAAAATTLVTLTACGSPHTTQPGEPAPPSASVTPPRIPAPTTDTDGSTTSPSPTATSSDRSPTPPSITPADARPVRTLRGAFEEKAVIAEIYPIERGTRTATVNVRFRLVTPDGIGFRIYQSLSDHKPELGDRGKTAPDGLRLIDTAAGKAYLPATIGDGQCLCSPRVNNALDRVDDLTVTVAFAAPPATLSRMDLMVPGFRTVSDVPLH